MPVRQDVQGSVEAQNIQGYQSPGAARAQFQGVDLSGVQQDAARTSQFWSNLIPRAERAGNVIEQKARAEAYLAGQQDNALGKARQDVHSYMQDSYEEGYNRAQVGTDLAKFQMDVQTKAMEFVNSGKSPDEFQQYVKERTDGILNSAGEQGLNLNDRDWQAWLTGVQSTRDTAADLYQKKNLERSQYQKQQALAAEGSASIATFMAADEAGNPMQALGNMTSHISRVYADPTLSLEQKDGALSAYAMQVMTAAKSSGAVEGVSSYFQALPEFQRLPTNVQTQIMTGAQSAYNQRAADESGAVYAYTSQVRAVSDVGTLESEYPMSTYISTLNDAQKAKKISPGQMYSMVNEEATRRLKLQKAATKSQALMNAPTMTDISTITGDTLGKTKTALVESYAQGNGGYSGGGLALMQRGLKSGAQDIMAVGIEMMQQDAQSMAGINSKDLKRDSDGSPMYPSTVVSSLGNLKNAYDAAQKAGNTVMANQLLSGLPDAVAYGIRQGVDANSIADSTYRRADDLAAGRVVSLPVTMPKEMLATTDDVTAGLFDTGLTQKGAARNILGIKSYMFTSKADSEAQDTRLQQVNSAISEEYTSLQQQGKLPARSGDDLKNYLIGRVTARTVRVDDGSDNGTLMILPNVANKQALFGSTDNNLIAEGLKESVLAFKQSNPGAKTVQMRYDNMTNELVFSATDANNVLMTSSEGLPASQVQAQVRAVEARITAGGLGKTTGDLAIPGKGFVQFNTANGLGVDPTVYKSAVTQLVGYEGYTDSKGFSILSEHPVTGAPLNEAKYVKQPEDTPQVAANKFNMYLNDKVLPPVMSSMAQYNSMPETLKQRIFSQLVETTYHSGSPQAFSSYVNMVLEGRTKEAYDAFRDSPLFKDAGGIDSRRNKDRFQTLDAVSQYSLFQRTGQ